MNINLKFIIEDVKEIGVDYKHLEHPSMAARLTNFVGLPIERSLKLLPKTWHENLQQGLNRTLLTALESIINPLDNQPGTVTQEGYHKLLAATSGALGGFFGLPAVIA